MDTKVFDFLYNCDLNEGQGHPHLYQNVELSGSISSYKLVWIQTKVNVFFNKIRLEFPA